MQRIRPTGHDLVLLVDPLGGVNSGDALERYDILVALDGQEVFDVTTLLPLVSASLTVRRLGESDEEVYVDVLRLKDLCC